MEQEKVKYSDQEKQKIIAEARDCGNVSATARKYSVSDITVHNWIKKFNKSKNEKDLHQQIRKLENQLADKNLENAILKDLVKKTVQVFSSDESSLMNTSPSNLLKRKY